MELKKLLTQFIYRIEPKPDGGFIARPSDPSAPPLEAPTREELQRKIQANIASALSAEFPGLKLPTQAQQQLNVSFHIEHKPDGTFDLHSSDPALASVQGANSNEIESHFAEKILGFVGKHLSPEFSQAIGEQLASGNVKVFVTKGSQDLTLRLNSSSTSVVDSTNTAGGPGFTPAQFGPAADAGNTGVISNSSFRINANDNSPITPASERSNPIFRFLIAAIIVLAVMYAFVHFHR